MNAIKMAIMFYKLHEELAPEYEYETKDTKIFNASTPNGKLMIRVCREMQKFLKIEQKTPEDSRLPCIHPELTQDDCNCLDIDGACLVEEFYQGDWECLWETDREAVREEEPWLEHIPR